MVAEVRSQTLVKAPQGEDSLDRRSVRQVARLVTK
jgi:hypothetical protein